MEKKSLIFAVAAIVSGFLLLFALLGTEFTLFIAAPAFAWLLVAAFIFSLSVTLVLEKGKKNYIPVSIPRLKNIPMKKVIVCGLIVLAGTALTGVVAGVLPQMNGWTPVGFELVVCAFPLLVSIGIAISWWNKH